MYKTIVWAMVCVSNNILNNFQCYSKHETIILLNDGNAAAVIEVDGRNSCWERTDRPANSFMFFFSFSWKENSIYLQYVFNMFNSNNLFSIEDNFSYFLFHGTFWSVHLLWKKKKNLSMAKLMQVEWLQTPYNPVIVAIIIQKTIIRHLGILAKN